LLVGAAAAPLVIWSGAEVVEEIGGAGAEVLEEIGGAGAVVGVVAGGAVVARVVWEVTAIVVGGGGARVVVEGAAVAVDWKVWIAVE
jgi:hypothetical protein